MNIIPLRLEDRKPREAGDTSWKSKLISRQTKSGAVIKPLTANVVTVLEHDERWRGVFAFDAFKLTIVKRKSPPWDDDDRPASEPLGEVSETDSVRLQNWMARNYDGLEVSRQIVDDAIRMVAERSTMHGVRDWLNSLVWDGVPRLDRLFVEYFGAKDDAYHRGIGRLWAISAIARAFRPGCQVDYMPILEGPQGARKSTGLEALAGKQNFSDTGLDLSDKDSEQNLAGVWIYCLDELDSLRGREVTRIKNYLTRRVAHFRPSYGRKAGDFARQCVFAGTTNEPEYLVDRTGNRRFWPVRCGFVDVVAIEQDRDQLWAEALTAYHLGERWWPDASLERRCRDEQSERMQGDPWESAVLNYAEKPFLIERLADHATRADVDPSEGFTVADVLTHGLGKRLGETSKGDEMRVAAILREAKYEKSRERRKGERLVRWFKIGEHTSHVSPEVCQLGAATEGM